MTSGRPPSYLSQPRQNSNPFASSPLHAHFPAYDNSALSIPHDTPSRSARTPEPKPRGRAESRSSSVPVRLQVPHLRMEASMPHLRENNRSVKHLTCFWWKEKGACRFSDEDCLYAHYDTGRYTDAPRQIIPGEPAKAGRSLDRALKSLTLTSNKSSTSLSTQGLTRSVTPGLELKTTPPSNHSSFDFGASQSDNSFLRGLVEQANREKANLMSIIEDLQKDKSTLQSKLETLQSENDKIIQERDSLRAVVNIQQQRSLSSPWGAIGSGVSRVGRSTPALTSADPNHPFRSFTGGKPSSMGGGMSHEMNEM